MIQRMRVAIRGAVQGVGFRPFVYKLATEMKLPGWVLNAPEGVFLETEGETSDLESFLLRLQKEKPSLAHIQSLEFSFLDPVHFTGFEIRESESQGARSALILPDIATCAECLSEVLDPAARRHRYPFTNCTHCGPRFTIIEDLPYDRCNTSMKSFAMCPDCRREYEDPADRRFHAQPIACPVCGPSLQLWDRGGMVLSECDDALREAAEAVRRGRIVALKGLGGFHLLADARNPGAVETLRTRKRREEKPFALMYPSMEDIRADCAVSELEARLLTAPESPIVLLSRREGSGRRVIAENVAPANPYLGVMLPYTPLHHLLMREIGFPVVATSGNLSDEPILTEEHDALRRLGGIADLFLVHNRPIVRHADDSIVRVMMGRELLLRRARGYAPLPVDCGRTVPGILGVGAHLKNTVALSVGNSIFVSQHVGDLENRESFMSFQRVIQDFRRLYRTEPARIAADMHPDYLSTKYAKDSGIPLIQIQHHFAHVAACMAENEISGRVLGVSWDGTGYGPDGTVWGGEFLLTDGGSFTRVAAFRKFRLPGGAAAVKEPRRAALGVLYEIMGDGVFGRKDLIPVGAFSDSELRVLAKMLGNDIHSPWTTSAGRLFDAAASLAGLRQRMRFEGQAAMELEFAAFREKTDESYPFFLNRTDAGNTGKEAFITADWEPLVAAMINDVRDQIPLARIARRFHNTLVEIIVETARAVGEERVVLTGGCFQNRLLTERSVVRLRAEGFKPYWHQRIPPNDGGISLGQVVAAGRWV